MAKDRPGSHDEAKIVAIVPCYNTSTASVPVLTGAAAHVTSVLAIDDGSTDDTAEAIARTGCAVLRLAHNSGKGAALHAGFEEVLEHHRLFDCGFDYIVTLDGDGQHDPAEIPRLVAAAQAGHDLIIGVRDLGVMPLKSRIGNSISRALFFLATGHVVQDTQSGFRVLSTGAARRLLPRVTWARYESETQLLSEAIALGMTIGTVPISTIYIDANRRTHFRPLRDSSRVVAVLFRYATGSLTAAAIDYGTFALLVGWIDLDLVAANVLARAASVSTHFILSRHLAFRSTGKLFSQMCRYGLVALANLALVTVILVVLVTQAGLNPYLAKLVAQTFGFLFSFGSLRAFVFEPAR
ncbi:MAG: bifunctional glycosyltransferase family 2/GtrA family protein [Acidobacteria bacterium]|nr:bifunctional glycosyltransferase family 2/GtrA family protein [Acidobacteriota bacterium]